MKSKAKARVKSTEIGCSVKSTIHKNVIKKRKPAEKTTRSNSGSRKSTKNVSPKDLAGKNEIQANNLPMRRVAWVLNSVGDASRDTTGGSTDDNMNEDLQDIPDHLGRKSCLKKIMPKIESEGQSRKKRASEQSDYNMDTMEDAGSSGISASTKEKSVLVKKDRKKRMKNFVKSEKSEKKEENSAIPTAEPKKNADINGGGDATDGKVKEKFSSGERRFSISHSRIGCERIISEDSDQFAQRLARYSEINGANEV
ncbi:unnamed protein product [Acanthocheilonema viteae]|uniref:Uncharacterized protein n=1 Tax=Acanthocheilonema viteae TaxID=6277 RepID=A0A498SHT0_ACAVI|nr:unnamed protein product [Acanthocheilonema viteae]